MKWDLLDTGVASAEKNMALDYALLEELGSRKNPLLHLYDWETDSATYGHFIDPSEWLNENEVSKKQLSLAKRPTGGGLIFHQWDYAFSVLIPSTHPFYTTNTLENYAFVNHCVAKSIRRFLQMQEIPDLLQEEPVEETPASKHFCMAKPTKYDVMYNGRKVGGAAQRKTKEGFLHQGTIALLVPDPVYIASITKEGSLLSKAMQRNTFPLIHDQKDLADARREMRQFLIEEFTQSA